MADQQNQDQSDGSKTLVSFVVGLLIGGMLVWAFSGPDDHSDHDDDTDPVAAEEADSEGSLMDDLADGAEAAVDAVTDNLPTLPVGDGSVAVSDQPAGTVVNLERATYPVSEGWIGVQDYDGTTFGTLLGVVQFSESAGIVPENIDLQFPTTAGRQYAIVIYESDGVRGFSAADQRLDTVFDTFVAQ